jgi:hypothetical protein
MARKSATPPTVCESGKDGSTFFVRASTRITVN